MSDTKAGEKMNKILVLFLDFHNTDKSQGKQIFSNGFKRRRVTGYVFWARYIQVLVLK